MTDLRRVDCNDDEVWATAACCVACHGGEDRAARRQLMRRCRLDICCAAFSRASHVLEVTDEEVLLLSEQLRWRHGRVDLSAVIDTASLGSSPPFPPLRLVRDGEPMT